jgi:hypothetical protein
MARVLKVASRQGNTLSPVIRAAWDGGILQVMTKVAPARATDAHISIVGHVTARELRRELTETEMANGFANRFIWIAVRRTTLLPEPPVFVADPEIVATLGAAIAHARHAGLIERSDDAKQLWAEMYPALEAERGGLVASLTARGSPQVLRLSVLYALLDGTTAVEPGHLLSAAAVWAYSEQSAAYVFGEATGDPVADRIVQGLQHGDLSRSDVRDLFGRHESSDRVSHALESLAANGTIRQYVMDTGGRPREIWTLT